MSLGVPGILDLKQRGIIELLIRKHTYLPKDSNLAHGGEAEAMSMGQVKLAFILLAVAMGLCLICLALEITV
jgi:hypothetical protein